MKEVVLTYWINNCDALSFMDDIKSDDKVVRVSVVYGDDDMTLFEVVKRFHRYKPTKV